MQYCMLTSHEPKPALSADHRHCSQAIILSSGIGWLLAIEWLGCNQIGLAITSPLAPQRGVSKLQDKTCFNSFMLHNS